MAMPFLLALAEETPPALLRFLGRSHALVVHFPIALLIVAGLIELYGSRKNKKAHSEAAVVCLVLGATMAAVAAWFGWMNAAYERYPRSIEDTIFWHRWIGVATAVLAWITVFLAQAARTLRSEAALRGYRFGLAGVVVLVSGGAHLGAELVHGEGYLLEVFEKREPTEPADAGPVASGEQADGAPAVALSGETRSSETPPVTPPVPDLGSGAPTDPPDEEPAQRVDYVTQIKPIFMARCVECHGPEKSKGRLRLDSMDEVFYGYEEDWVIQPGSSETSLLVELITLPADDEGRMPSEKDPLTSAEIELIRAWIDGGAIWVEPPALPAPAAATAQSADDPPAKPLVEVATEGESGQAIDEVAQREALARLSASGVPAGRLAQNTVMVEVNFGLRSGAEVKDDDLELLRGLEETLVSLDLARTAITDAGLVRLADFPRLRRLSLYRTGVGDEGLRHLTALDELEYLNLYGTQVTDEGLSHLEGIEGLSKVFLWESRVTVDGIAALAAALPDATIVGAVAPTPAQEEAEDAEETAATVAKLHAPCCDAAAEKGEVCDHPCCVAAALRGEVCPKCGVEVSDEDD